MVGDFVLLVAECAGGFVSGGIRCGDELIRGDIHSNARAAIDVSLGHAEGGRRHLTCGFTVIHRHHITRCIPHIVRGLPQRGELVVGIDMFGYPVAHGVVIKPQVLLRAAI